MTQRPAGVVAFEPDPQHFPFTSRWFDSSVGPVHYVDQGGGRPVLMLHGNPDWSFLYRHVISLLDDDYRCVALDYPGFGLSVHPEGYGYTSAEHARVTAELVEHLDLTDAIVVGQDWGGPIGMDVASRRPDRFSGIAMANTWFWPSDDRLMRSFSALMSSRAVQWAIVNKNAFVDPGMKRSLIADVPDDAFDHYRHVVPTPSSRRGIAEFPKQIRDARPWLVELESRVAATLSGRDVTLVWGMKDPAFGRRSIIERWLRTFPQAKVTELANAGHYLQEDAPDELAAAIRESFPAG